MSARGRVRIPRPAPRSRRGCHGWPSLRTRRTAGCSPSAAPRSPRARRPPRPGRRPRSSRSRSRRSSRVDPEVMEPRRMGRLARVRPEDRVGVSDALVAERVDPLDTGLRPDVVQEQDVGPLEHATELAFIGSELLDDPGVPVALVRHRSDPPCPPRAGAGPPCCGRRRLSPPAGNLQLGETSCSARTLIPGTGSVDPLRESRTALTILSVFAPSELRRRNGLSD